MNKTEIRSNRTTKEIASNERRVEFLYGVYESVQVKPHGLDSIRIECRNNCFPQLVAKQT